MPTNPESVDFELTKYGYDRQHEIELNKFTHALEVEQLKLLILLNGGGAAALLSFADTSGFSMSLAGLFVPVLLWILGLGSAATATLRMRQLQAEYTKAYRHRRNATEWRRFHEKHGVKRVNPFGLPDNVLLAELKTNLTGEEGRQFAAAEKIGNGDVLYDLAATYLRQRADSRKDWISWLSAASIGAFIVGALFAAGVATFAR